LFQRLQGRPARPPSAPAILPRSCCTPSSTW